MARLTRTAAGPGSRIVVPTTPPAAFPVLSFVAGLVVSPHLVHPIVTIGALSFVTVLLHRLAGLRAALLIAFVTLGLVAGVHDLGVNARIDALLKESSTSFRTVTVPLESAWHATPTGYRIAASRFFSEGMTIRRPITIYASALPPASRSAQE